MTSSLWAIGILLASGLLALALPRLCWLGAAGAVAGAVAGLVSCFRLLGGAAAESLQLPWSIPGGSLSLELDALGAFFLAPVWIVTALAAVYGVEYLGRHPRAPLAAALFNLLTACMVVVVLSRNALLFLVAWEGMALSSFGLVMLEDEKASVRSAGWTYLAASQLGTAALLLMFILLGASAGSLDFDRFSAAGRGGWILALGLVGFGTKAGFIPLHTWLPEAHPAAPSHVSAVMSGVMIKMGIYGLVRLLGLLDPLPAAAGWWFTAIGISSGLLGVIYALAQHDLKRLLAYHSVENIGIIMLGLGVGLLGVRYGLPAMAAAGFAGGLFHVLNHALFKSLLFLGAGSVLHATGTRDLDRLGGLVKTMPVTAAAFLAGALAICGLPPFNGFASEFLVYLGAFHGATASAQGPVWGGLAVLVALSAIGGLALACFAKAFTVVFLGHAREARPQPAHDPGPAMKAPMLLLAALCLAIGLGATRLFPAFESILARRPDAAVQAAALGDARAALGTASGAMALFVALVLLAALWRLRRLAGKPVTQGVTWDCGYAAPAATMQYTGSSMAQPLTEFLDPVLRAKRHIERPAGYFPARASFVSHAPDFFHRFAYRPLAALGARLLAPLRRVQHGNVHLYVLYIALTLLALLAWRLGTR